MGDVITFQNRSTTRKPQNASTSNIADNAAKMCASIDQVQAEWLTMRNGLQSATTRLNAFQLRLARSQSLHTSVMKAIELIERQSGKEMSH